MLSIVLLTAALTPDANACAGIFHEEGRLAESDNQEVILEDLGDGAARAHYRAIYNGDSADFGWIIPIPGEATALEDGDAELFATLRERTAPTVEYLYSSDDGGSTGCRSAKSDNAMAGGTTTLEDRGNGVDVLEEGFTGTYDYTLVAATDASELVDWLTENGWSVGGSEAELAAYVADGWQFAALSVTPDSAETSDEGRELPPVTITYDGDVAFPARMAASAGAISQRTTLYVIGAHQAQMSGWDSEALATVSGGLDDDPESLFLDSLSALSASEASYALTYSREDGDQWITRFDTLTAAADHTEDVWMTFDGDNAAMHAHISLSEDGASTSRRSSHGALLLLPLLGIGWSLRRRR